MEKEKCVKLKTKNIVCAVLLLILQQIVLIKQ